MGEKIIALAPEEELRAKPLKRLPIASEPPALAPARMINEVLYCERLAALEWVHGEFADNEHTTDGRFVHRRVDVPGGELAEPLARGKASREQPAPNDETAHDGEPSPNIVRSVWLTSDRLGITAKIDLVEEIDGRATPVDYKRGKVPDVPEGAYLPERAQIGAQVLVLREHGYDSVGGILYFAGSRRRVRVVVDAELEAIVITAAERLREIAADAALPPPFDDSPKCYGCSLVSICLPDEVTLLKRLDADLIEAPTLPLPGMEEPKDPGLERRLVPAREDREVLYVQEAGARVRLDAERLVVVSRDGGRTTARLPNTSQVCLFGPAQISTQAIHALLERGIPLCFFTTGGYFKGRTLSLTSNDVHLRLAQYRVVEDAERSLSIARGCIASKIRNCRTLLRRNHNDPDDVVLGQLEQLAKKAERADSAETLLGLEGAAGRAYFQSFTGMLKGSDERLAAFDLERRNRRPPTDRVNALLSFCYALLTKELTVTAGNVGLDPLLGFYHRPRFGRPGLALDLMEEMRPLLADSTVLHLINTGAIQADDFIVHAGASVALTPVGRKKVLAAFERRLAQQVSHPIFGYRISYRRVLEVQARLLARLLLGDIRELPAFRVR